MNLITFYEDTLATPRHCFLTGSYAKPDMIRFIVSIAYHNIILLSTLWWEYLGSNQGSHDYRSCALPTKLYSQMEPSVGLEPTTYGFVDRCSVQLNYEGMEGDIGFAPMMRGLQPRALVYLANHP